MPIAEIVKTIRRLHPKHRRTVAGYFAHDLFFTDRTKAEFIERCGFPASDAWRILANTRRCV